MPLSHTITLFPLLSVVIPVSLPASSGSLDPILQYGHAPVVLENGRVPRACAQNIPKIGENVKIYYGINYTLKNKLYIKKYIITNREGEVLVQGCLGGQLAGCGGERGREGEEEVVGIVLFLFSVSLPVEHAIHLPE